MESWNDFERSYQRLHEDSLIVPGEAHSVLTVSGADAVEWLQGQISQDLRGFQEGMVRRGCLLAPTGQILAILTLGHFGDRIFAFTPPGCVHSVLDRARSSIFMEDVSVSQNYGMADMIRGPHSAPLGEGRRGDVIEAQSHWAVRLDDPLESWLSLRHQEQCFVGASDAHPAAAEAIRLEVGAPKWGIDVNERTLPPELGEDFDRRFVSYDKGCWTGQEVVMRIKSRGHTNRVWRCVTSDFPLEPGNLVHFGEEQVGELTSAAFSPIRGHLGAAMLRNRASAEGTVVEVETQAGRVEALVRAFPLLPTASG